MAMSVTHLVIKGDPDKMKMGKLIKKNEERFSQFTAAQEREAILKAQEKRKKKAQKRLSK